jgi:hypothetical protein
VIDIQSARSRSHHSNRSAKLQRITGGISKMNLEAKVEMSIAM